MSIARQIQNLVLLTLIVTLFVLTVGFPAQAQLSLTSEEKEYVANRSVIRAASLDGGAPLQYADGEGNVRGISKRVLDRIADLTGLRFEYELYDTLAEVFTSGADIFFGLPPNYAPPGMVLSLPFLKSETIIYHNSGLDPTELAGKRFTALTGGTLPKGITKENVIYHDNRDQSLYAVEHGLADYGYGNAYSVAFYMMQNGYRQITIIPKGQEPREYCIGFGIEDGLLLSILNKSIAVLDDNQMQSLILEVVSQVDRRLTPSMVMDSYGQEIVGSIIFVVGILAFSVVIYMRLNDKLHMRNKIYDTLAQLSNEYLYEYDLAENRLEFTDTFVQRFSSQKDLELVSGILRKRLALDRNQDTFEILLPLEGGKMGVFKSTNSTVKDERKKTHSIVGKLVDISEEAAEKDELIARSQTDGLTGLYNATTTRKLVSNILETRKKPRTDAFILLDCDKFKAVNDTYGHLIGDSVLEHVAKSLKSVFRQTDIIGRVGGDEFCVYVKNIPSSGFIHERCEQLVTYINKPLGLVQVSVSIGITIVGEERVYEEIFTKADRALYQAKAQEANRIVLYADQENPP